MSFKMDTSDILNGLMSLENKTKAAINVYADTVAKKMEAHAKSNRPWQDNTGQARGRLTGTSTRLSGSVVRCNLSHGVSYGVYLEVCNEGKYAILKPTVDAIGPSAVKGLSNLLK